MSNYAKKKKSRNGKGQTRVAVAEAKDLQLLLDTANALDPADPKATIIGGEGFTQAVAFRCVHSAGTPGLVTNFEQYLAHRLTCRIATVGTKISDFPDAVPPRIILPQ